MTGQLLRSKPHLRLGHLFIPFNDLYRGQISLLDLKMRFCHSTAAALFGTATLVAAAAIEHRPDTATLHQKRGIVGRQADIPAPPNPEPIVVTELPLPPAISSTAEGACTEAINSRRTGCIPQDAGLNAGNFLPDGIHVLVTLNFTGAPAAPDPASIYTGPFPQLILVKADGTTFPNGDAWKCITCGVPEANQVGRDATMDYPQAFSDGIRVLSGKHIIDCGSAQLASTDCTPDKVHIYPIRWNNQVDGSGAGGSIRELRLHPDNVHLGYSSPGLKDGHLTQFSYFSRLSFNSAPTTGTPLTPRYDLINVNTLFDPTAVQPITVDGDQMFYNEDSITIGELRGFSGRGDEVSYVGYSVESSNIDVFAADLTTGAVRRLTANPEYVDPVDISPDDSWTVVMDTRGSGRQLFMAGMRGIPPLIDLVASTAASSTRNNGRRRFFQPYLIDRYGDRGDYNGQKINEAGDGSPGSINDPNWNGRADPKWSPDGTRIVYWQELVMAPACGGSNPLPCPVSTAQGGRFQRVMVAQLTTRTPLKPEAVAARPDVIPWGTPFELGSGTPTRPFPPQGTYTFQGKVSGSAEVVTTESSTGLSLITVAVTYTNFSDDGINVLVGTEQVTNINSSPTLNLVDWYSNLTSTGTTVTTKITSSDGFHLTIDALQNIFNANGTLTTTIDGVEWEQPANET